MNAPQFHVTEISDAYWRASFGNGSDNSVDPDTIEELDGLVARIEAAPALTVVVFDSLNRETFMAHWDITTDRARLTAMRPRPSGLHPYVDNLVRLSKVPAVTVAAVRGRADGAGSEFVLATDIRFAGPQAVLGQFEVGMGSVPGGNPMGRLTRLAGKARAMEILLGADDFPADLAAAYGYVNRVLPPGELDGFVDAFARRVAGFDRVAVTEAKALVVASLPIPDEEPAASLAAYFRTSGRPETADRMTRLLERGLQRADGAEVDLGRQVAEPR